MNVLPFLEELAQKLYTQHGKHISKLTIVFPNWRSGLAFQRHLSAQLPKPMWAPQVQSMEALIRPISPLRPARILPLITKLYQTFQDLRLHDSEVTQQESLAQFYRWGAMLLQDFDVVDRYLVEARHLFRDLSKQKELSTTYDHLTHTQREAILSFWKSFGTRLSSHQQKFLKLWKVLPQVYTAFSTQLRAQHIGYTGLCQRTAYEALREGTTSIPATHIVFAGFSALSPVEEKIMAWCHEHLPTDFYWDVDAYYMKNDLQEAGDYLRVYRRRPHFQQSFPQVLPARLQDASKRIKLMATASAVEQVQRLAGQLRALAQAQGDGFVPGKTAIVVANERLLLPLLHALPAEHPPVNVAMGYPLRNTATYQLLDKLLALQVAAGQEAWPAGYLATQYILPLLRHAGVAGNEKAPAHQLCQQLQKSGQRYVEQRILASLGALYQVLFKPLTPNESPAQYLVACLEALREANVDQESPLVRSIECRSIEKLLQASKQLVATLQPYTTSLEDFTQLFQHYARSLQISLEQGNANAIQLLSVLETKNLDFDNIFILGMNEDDFPAQTAPNTFIPYNLRRGYGLPTADKYQASLFAYHFYRLLQRAQNVYLTYSTQTSAGNAGEMSRYLYQLLYEAKLPVASHTAPQSLHVPAVSPIEVPKTVPILQQLDQWTTQSSGAVRGLTPSALNTYLDCSLRFYFRYIARLKPPEPSSPVVDTQRFGLLFHAVMEQLYTPLLRKSQQQPLQAEDFVALRPKVAPMVEQVLAQQLRLGNEQLVPPKDQHIIAQKVLQRLVARVVKLDEEYAPFTLLGLEVGRAHPLSATIALQHGKEVRLSGIIDRVDQKDGTVRTLDYKTGNDSKRITSITALLDSNSRTRNGAALQTLLYAWLFQQNYPDAGVVTPGLINSRQVFNKSFTTHFSIKIPNSKSYVPFLDISAHKRAFEAELREVLEELWDPETSFAQTEDASRCVHCPYKGICQRH
ncbi:MAG: PD-(D/E)XK nuclease family protein [Bacteroidota bacterium]